MKIRLKFTKQGAVKFVGHLDMIRLFQRAIKVAKIPIAYSQGFNPHALVYFAMPLSVGTSSIGEYMDIVIASENDKSIDIEANKVKDALNEILPEGICIIDAFIASEEGVGSLMSLVHAASYEMAIPKKEFKGLNAESINDKLSQEELITEKKGKKGIKTVDIKPMLLAYDTYETENDIMLSIKALAGSNENLSPQVFLNAVLNEEQIQYKGICITRKELYVNDNGTYKALDTYRRNG